MTESLGWHGGQAVWTPPSISTPSWCKAVPSFDHCYNNSPEIYCSSMKRQCAWGNRFREREYLSTTKDNTKTSPLPYFSLFKTKWTFLFTQGRRYFFILLYWMYTLLLKRPSVFALSLAIQTPNIIFFSETENALEIRRVFLSLWIGNHIPAL